MVSETLKIVDNEDVDIGVKKQKRADVAKALSTFVATHYMLTMKTLFYHWNVTGRHFHSLHETFEGQYEELNEAGDVLAERVRALGHFIPGSFREYTKLSALTEDDKLPGSPEEMVANLLKDNETCSKEARKVLKVAEDAEDEVTVDMMIERMAQHEEAAWMLRATLEN